jgi:imidazoleglycerol-phosphate dehydratase
MRTASVSRETKETRIAVTVNLDGAGTASINTGVGFFDHMLDHVARHGLIDLEVKAEGDLHIDPHHTVEDVGICLGKAVLQAVGEPKGLVRFGHAVVPMDEALAEVALDFSGRPFLVFEAELPKARLGEFDAELAEEFLRAFAVQSRISLHVNLRYGKNLHHCIEALFKALGRALRQALTLDPRVQSVPSTKGMLEA